MESDKLCVQCFCFYRDLFDGSRTLKQCHEQSTARAKKLLLVTCGPNKFEEGTEAPPGKFGCERCKSWKNIHSVTQEGFQQLFESIATWDAPYKKEMSEVELE